MNRNRMTGVITCALITSLLYSIFYRKVDGIYKTKADEISQNLKRYVIGNVGAIFEARKKHLSDACLIKGYKQPSSISGSTYTRFTFVETRHKIIYCQVQKVGSKFWRSVLKAMGGPRLEHFRDVIKACSENIYLNDCGIENAVSLLVVRDPYTKLFSAYVDKLYHPNYLFWKIAGEPISIMKNNINGSLCENHISFSDFIKYIIYETNGGRRGSLDHHFTQIYEHCDPCTAHYDYIMKFENFREEFNYIINDWNIRHNLSISEYSEQISAINIASKHINLSFANIELFSTECKISVYNFILRTWRFLQITGVIPKEAVMPFQDNENTPQIVTREKLLQSVFDVIFRIKDWKRVKEQRHEALVQAYQSIDAKDIIQLREIVRPDCFYFGYDETPNYLFERNSETFNYFQWT